MKPIVFLLLLAQQVVNVGVLVAPGQEAYVRSSSELSAALARGGRIRLAPIGTYPGNFVVSVEGTSVLGASLPEARVAEGATGLYTLLPADRTLPALRIAASRVTVSGVGLGPLPDRASITAGSATEPDPLKQPTDVVIDQIECVAASTGGRRCMEAHTRNFALLNSRIIGYWYQGSDSQAFLSYNGPGPYRIENNELQGSGENILFGGASIASAGNVPSDITIRGNYIYKPAEWRAIAGSVKNSVEFKAAKRALVEDNIIDGCWKSAQDGDCFTVTPRNQNNDSPWTVVEDITIRRNVVRHHTDGFFLNALGRDNNFPSLQTARITVDHNLAEDSPKGFKILGGVADYLRITNNTMPAIKWQLAYFEGQTVRTPFTMTANVLASGEYGITGPLGNGGGALDAYTLNPVVTNNVIEKNAIRNNTWPGGNTFLDPGALAAKLDSKFHYTGLPIGVGY